MTNWTSHILAALRTYKELKANTLVPRAFVVPSDDNRWIDSTLGYRLSAKGITTSDSHEIVSPRYM